jgi:hypothetical protein
MKLNTISSALQLLKLGIHANERSHQLTSKRLWLFRLFKWGCFGIWWGFIAYLIFKWFNG